MTYPTLTTERLTLRGPRDSDFEYVRAYNASPRSCFTGGPIDDLFDSWRGFLGSIGHWTLRGYGFFTICLTSDSTPVGRAGILNHIMWEEPELGWHLFDGFEGQGYATEAAAAARDWAAAERGLGALVSYVHPDNAASRRVAERLGARNEGNTTLLGHPAQIWRHRTPGTVT